MLKDRVEAEDKKGLESASAMEEAVIDNERVLDEVGKIINSKNISEPQLRASFSMIKAEQARMDKDAEDRAEKLRGSVFKYMNNVYEKGTRVDGATTIALALSFVGHQGFCDKTQQAIVPVTIFLVLALFQVVCTSKQTKQQKKEIGENYLKM